MRTVCWYSLSFYLQMLQIDTQIFADGYINGTYIERMIEYEWITNKMLISEWDDAVCDARNDDSISTADYKLMVFSI